MNLKIIKGVPEAIQPTVLLGKANELIHIYTGEFILTQNEKQLTVVGEINFHWFSDRRTSFSGKVPHFK